MTIRTLYRGANPLPPPASATARLALLVLLIALGVSCSKDAPEEVESETVVPVTTAAATLGSITASINVTGLVTPAPGAELIVVAPEAARIVEMPKAEGDTVRRGDVLVRFEIPSATAEASKQRAEITRAEARVTTAKAAQARAQDLFGRGVAARKEVEDATKEMADAEADLAGAQAAATAAETVAARSTVRATFDGIVSKRSHNPGDLVEASASDAVMRVVDPRRLEVAASVPVAEAARVRIGAPAHLVGSGTVMPSLKVASHPAAVEQGTATVPVRLAFTTPPNFAVGTPVQVAIDAETHKGVVLVPAAAIVHQGGERAVFVLMGDPGQSSTAQRRDVMTGLETADQVEVVSGVKAGEMVLTSGQNGLPDGAKVTLAKPGSAAAGGNAAGDEKTDEKKDADQP